MRNYFRLWCLTFAVSGHLRYRLWLSSKSFMDSAHSTTVSRFEGIHSKCRNGAYPRSEITRANVPDEKVSWDVEWSDYKPPEYTDAKVLKADWADPPAEDPNFKPNFNAMDGKVDRRSFVKKYDVVNKRPLNPVGRTGLVGRGSLGRWGPNHAADPIVTRWKKSQGDVIVNSQSAKPILQFVAILRGDCKEWAIPGGMVDPGEEVSATLKREFGEEALNSMTMNEGEKSDLEKQLHMLFEKGDQIYAGYVDDPRNTDNAWMETVAVNFHDEKGLSASRIDLRAGSDASHVQWTDLHSGLRLYASHQQILEKVVRLRNAHW